MIAPERIWAFFEVHKSGKGPLVVFASASETRGHEYVRADLCSPSAATMRDLIAEAEVERLRAAITSAIAAYGLSGNPANLIEALQGARTGRGDVRI